MATEYTGIGTGLPPAKATDGAAGTPNDTGIKTKAKEALSRVSDRAGEKIETTITEQKTRAAGRLSGVAQSLLTSSEQLRTDGQEDVSRYIEKAADQVDRLANYLQGADVQEVVGRVEKFARRQPAAFMAGAFAVGFLASRFLKSSGDEPSYGSAPSTGAGRSYGYELGGNSRHARSHERHAGSTRHAVESNSDQGAGQRKH